MLNNWGPSFVGKNLEIVINAYKSDGINVTWDAASDSNPELTSFGNFHKFEKAAFSSPPIVSATTLPASAPIRC